MKVLLTGATGFLGTNVLKVLSGKLEIFPLVRRTEPVAWYDQSKVIKSDLSCDGSTSALKGKFDAILHFAQANVTFPEGATELFKVNLMSTQLLADYARKNGVNKFIFASTGNVYSPSTEPLGENTACAPVEYYAMTKRSSEIILQNYSPYFVVIVLRFFGIYGPGQVARIIPKVVDRVRNGQNVVLVNGGQPFLNPIYVDDCVEVVRKSLDLTNSTTLNVGGDDVVGIKDMAENAGKILGKSVHFELREDNLKRNLVGKNDRMKQLLGISKLTPFPEGLKKTLQA